MQSEHSSGSQRGIFHRLHRLRTKKIIATIAARTRMAKTVSMFSKNHMNITYRPNSPFFT